jgi:hypothetical protein
MESLNPRILPSRDTIDTIDTLFSQSTNTTSASVMTAGDVVPFLLDTQYHHLLNSNHHTGKIDSQHSRQIHVHESYSQRPLKLTFVNQMHMHFNQLYLERDDNATLEDGMNLPIFQ